MSRRQQSLIDLQYETLSYALEPVMDTLARRCAPVWGDAARLNSLLSLWSRRVPFSRLIYAIDSDGLQVSANVSQETLDEGRVGQDLSHRPYLSEPGARSDFWLSEIYVSAVSGKPCVTAVQGVKRRGIDLGFIAIDFDLRDIPMLQSSFEQNADWRQLTGDPAIRNQVFARPRLESLLDENIEDVLAIMTELMGVRGVFHSKLHFSSSRATLWLTDDPYRYRIHVMEEIIHPSVCLAYRKRDYPPAALVDNDLIRPVFDRMAQLRRMDEYLYLRSGSLNVMNGLVGLTFSCDGSHYLNVEDFLEKGEAFWRGLD